jgi:hypothetical protein
VVGRLIAYLSEVSPYISMPNGLVSALGAQVGVETNNNREVLQTTENSSMSEDVIANQTIIQVNLE